jgi:hypothetical protein
VGGAQKCRGHAQILGGGKGGLAGKTLRVPYQRQRYIWVHIR